MAHLASMELEDGTIIYMEADEEIVAPTPPSSSEGITRTAKGASDKALKNFQAMEGTIKTYTTYALNAFKDVATANVDKVTLEFGVKVAGEGGIPYITKGSAESNLKITVECSFPE